MNATGTVNVNRTNYDRFEAEDGAVYSSATLRLMRERGTTVVVTDKTPADRGRWVLEPLPPGPGSELELPERLRP